ncbi:ribose-5-phosphate isomerase RpiA [Hyphobacterium marinum]|uniref:Ribose-5-phosphate isomerase A n=1 Tax=Hyphobacterium marinum TaxID=3116574 RepID=A0ABU7M0H7_9PROT|nr:ribose-5-phosphate isomerase RpiA [Hyphobacterium sp. Y6023]MEE2567283.1 ribose-5-phosphate isomerase RpiA [Hyphobacterium sp. Y6023]
MSAAGQKRTAAIAALDYVQDGMIVGLGSGSTSEVFVRELGKRVADGLSIIGIPTSESTAEVARESGITLSEVDKVDRIHVTVDGADEVDGRFRLIKGGGGCHLREKIIANASDLMVVIIDESKLVATLGQFPLPVEVDPFAFTVTAKKVFDALQSAGIQRPEVQLRRAGDSGKPFITDGGNYILDCACRAIPDPNAAAEALNRIPGMVEHGLFIGLARVVIVGEDSGARIMEL